MAILRFTRLVFAIAALLLSAWFLWGTLRPELGDFRQSMRALPSGVLLAAVTLDLLNQLVNAFLWRHAFAHCCVRPARIGLSAIIGVLGLSGLCKYIPGRVWPIVWQSIFFKEWEVEPSDTLVVASVTHAYSLLGGLLVGGTGCALADFPPLVRVAGGSVAGLTGALMLLGPSFAQRFFPEELRKRFAGIPRKTAFWLTAGYASCWAMHAWSGVILAQAIWPQLGWQEAFRVVGGMCAALIVGAAAFLAPGGLGVREVGLYHALSSLPGNLKALVPVYSRLSMILAEVIAALLSLALLAILGARPQLLRATKKYPSNERVS